MWSHDCDVAVSLNIHCGCGTSGEGCMASGRRVEKRVRMVARAGAAVTATQNATRRRLMPYFLHPSGSWCASLQHNIARDECERVGGRRAWRREAGCRARVTRSANGVGDVIRSAAPRVCVLSPFIPYVHNVLHATLAARIVGLSLAPLARSLVREWGCGRRVCACLVWLCCVFLPPSLLSLLFLSLLLALLPSSDCHRHGVVVEDGDVTRGGDECDRA